MNANVVSGYEIKDISIIKSDFFRVKDYDKGVPSELNVNISVQKEIEEPIAKCSLTVSCKVQNKKTQESLAEGTVTSYGIFEQVDDEAQLDMEDFARMNAMAIMYPYVREHLSTLSLKAGMKIIILPSVNFVKFARQEDQEGSLND